MRSIDLILVKHRKSFLLGSLISLASVLALMGCTPARVPNCAESTTSPGAVHACDGQMWLNGRPFEPGKRTERAPVLDGLPAPYTLDTPQQQSRKDSDHEY